MTEAAIMEKPFVIGEMNVIGMIILVLGALNLGMVLLSPDNFCLYSVLAARARPCVGTGNERKFIAEYSVMMLVVGTLIMLRVFEHIFYHAGTEHGGIAT